MTAPAVDPSFRLSTEDLTRRTMHRIYWRNNDPLVASVAGNNRYDCSPTLAAPARYGVLYLAFNLETCWMETVVRGNMVRRRQCANARALFAAQLLRRYRFDSALHSVDAR